MQENGPITYMRCINFEESILACCRHYLDCSLCKQILCFRTFEAMSSHNYLSLLLLLLDRFQFGSFQNSIELMEVETCDKPLAVISNNVIRCCDSPTQMHLKYLFKYLQALQAQNCSKFVQECRTRRYAFTEYADLVYLKFCNRSKLESKCFDDVRKIAGAEHTATWRDVAKSVDTFQLKGEDLINPCVQVAMLDRASTTHSRFHEVFAAVPFCSVIWCGFDEDLFEINKLSLWTCIPTK